MFQGVCLSVLASVTFGVLYFYTQLLTGFGSEQTFGWRMISTLPFLTLLMWMIGDLHYIRQVFTQIKKNPWFIWLLIVSSVLVSLQLWLFLWAPMNGRGLEVSLGYFLLPLVLVLIGSLFYKEKLSRFQQIAVLLAILGVAHEIWQQGTIAWETALVAVGYSAYFFLRKKMKTDHLGGFWWDIVIILPIAFYFVFMPTDISQPWPLSCLVWILAGLGFLSALGLGSYILASRFLPMVLFGLLSYLEPILLALVSLMLGEKISSQEWLTYIPIWVAVLLLVIEGAIHLYQQKQKSIMLERNLECYQNRIDEK
ncbi:chloramphenicol-sensitive protein RarD [Acinetobacter baylyi]|uniref:Chloramphenicol-sensitive protein RarD n=1 Tax=Acinetobacter baylyi TaxID=202950 RepID=A0ABU0V0D1_ACIBI|nr:EamA family transporter RarD [Acinetobacter baylyi]MDQ1210252.1 chloramphenicol-sensitive protein RarD [Acinetobacter baylyi]MDR6106153.1 chloramphenicol-sensitive protein RarD [Acinetobacter baylyi]MDR6187123.1 chloramphenicol-sensitive protein RarD [Acinetobacter baylyi]